MEIKAELKKPYTINEKMDFIVEQNHQKGYEIKETETSIEAWGYTEEEAIEVDFRTCYFFRGKAEKKLEIPSLYIVYKSSMTD